MIKMQYTYVLFIVKYWGSPLRMKDRKRITNILIPFLRGVVLSEVEVCIAQRNGVEAFQLRITNYEIRMKDRKSTTNIDMSGIQFVFFTHSL